RPFDGGRDRARAGMPGPLRMDRGASGDSAGVEILAERSVRGRIVVRALGRKLRVRHQRRAALAGNGVADGEGVLPARGKLAAVGAEGGWQLWRVAVELRQARE